VSAAVLALVVAGAIAHAAWNLTMKRAETSGSSFLWLAFGVGALVFAPFGVQSLVETGADLGRWALFAAVSGILQVGYFFMLQSAYSRSDVSVVYPLARGTAPLISVIAAFVLLGETPTLAGVAGAGLVIAGVVVIGFAGSRSRAGSVRAGILWGLAIGVVIATYTLWDATAVVTNRLPPVGLYWGSVVVQFILLTIPALRTTTARRATSVAGRQHWIAALVVGVLSPLAYILVLTAMQFAPVSLVAPGREVSVVLVSIAGWLWFREPHPVQRIAGSIVVVAGVALLALA
jgi:drug/metabolite transporter (DMT)-like permease